MTLLDNMGPLISVIIPCYNQAKYLPDSLNSVVKQTYQNWECIVINDGSSDNTVEEVGKWSLLDSRIRIVSQSNMGLSASRNKGLDEARGNYIQFLDADDCIAESKFEKQLNLLRKSEGLSLSYTDYLMGLDEDIYKTPVNIQRSLPRLVMDKPIYDIVSRWETLLSIPVHCFLFDAVFFKDFKIRFDDKLPNHEDWDCWMQIFTLNPLVFLLPEPLAIYRINNKGMCADRAKMWKGFKQAIEKQKILKKDDPVLRKLLNNKLDEMKSVYKQTSKQKFIAFYNKNVPWPLQELLSKFLSL